MNYGYQIEVVEGGFILTYTAQTYDHGLSALGLSKQTRHVFKDLDEMLEFLKQRLGNK